MTPDPFDPFEEQPMYVDLFLKFTDEAEANAVLFDAEKVNKLVPVSSSKVVKVLAGLQVSERDDLFVEIEGADGSVWQEAVTNSVEHQGKIYSSDAVGNWSEVVSVAKNLTPRYAAIDIVGIIYKPTGNMIQTDEGEVPEMAPLNGWHANVRHGAEVPELAAYAVQPKQPVRAWF